MIPVSRLFSLRIATATFFLLAQSAMMPVQAADRDRAAEAKAIINSYESSHRPLDKKFSKAIFDLGEEYLRDGQAAKAWPLFERSIQVIKAAPDGHPPDVAWRLEAVALRNEDAGKLAEAEAQLKEALSIIEHNKIRSGNQLLHFRILRHYMYRCRYDDAAPLFWKYLKSSDGGTAADDRLSITDSIFISDCANDIGQAFVVKGKFSEALPYLQKALEIRTRLARLYGKEEDVRKNTSIDLQTTLTTTGRCLQGLKRFAEAKAKLAQAAKLSTLNQPSINWSDLYCFLAIKELNKATASRAEREESRKGAPSLVPPKTAFAKFSESGDSTFWSIKYSAFERLNRETCWCWWDNDDTERFLLAAEQDARSFKPADPRKILTIFARALENVDNDDRKAMSDMNPLITTLAKSDPKLNEILVLKLIDSADEGYRRVQLIESIMDTLPALDSNVTLQKQLAVLFMKELKKNRWSERRIAEHVSKHTSFLERAMGKNHPDLVAILPSLAQELRMDMKYYDAMLIYRRIIELNKAKYGAKSPEVKKALLKYAELLYCTNDPENAAKAEREAAKIPGEVTPD